MSDVETNAARKSSGLRAIAYGLGVNPDLSVAQKVIRDAADKIEELERERDEARMQLENIKAISTHTCHAQCQRPMCVLRRERDEALAVADTLSAIASAYLGWHLSRTPHGVDDRSLEIARNVTAAIKQWKELKR